MSPLQISVFLWVAWVLSWGAAALWSRRTQARPSILAELSNRVPSAIGGLMLFYGSGVPGIRDYAFSPQLWRLPGPVAWALVATAAAGFAFTWWARLTLGDLWSSSVQRKDHHTIVETGPYALVRHPIYTGLIVAAFATALQFGALPNLAGAALLSFGFWMKARLEERFLSSQLGEAAYGDYRRRIPMLTPFWPMGR